MELNTYVIGALIIILFGAIWRLMLSSNKTLAKEFGIALINLGEKIEALVNVTKERDDKLWEVIDKWPEVYISKEIHRLECKAAHLELEAKLRGNHSVLGNQGGKKQ